MSDDPDDDLAPTDHTPGPDSNVVHPEHLPPVPPKPRPVGFAPQVT